MSIVAELLSRRPPWASNHGIKLAELSYLRMENDIQKVAAAAGLAVIIKITI